MAKKGKGGEEREVRKGGSERKMDKKREERTYRKKGSSRKKEPGNFLNCTHG